MSEAIISRRKKDINRVIDNTNRIDNSDSLWFDIPSGGFISATTTYAVPTNLASNEILVTLAAPKGSDSDTAKGLNGEIVSQTLSVEPGEEIPIFIGTEGTDGANGGSSSFGTYMMANGGLSANNATSSQSSYENQNPYEEGFAIIQVATADEEMEG